MSNIFVVNDNINNEQQYCKGCEKNLPLSSFTTNGKSYRTCDTCRTQNKAVYQRKKLADDDQMVIEFHDFYDFIAQRLDLFEHNERGEENNDNLELKISCIVDATIEGNSKEKASRIIEIISDVDEYTWM
jgi:hypothetical protein